MNLNQITGQLYVGTCPFNRDDLARLVDLSINSVINLQSDDDLAVNNIDWSVLKKEYSGHHIQAFRFPMTDFDEDNIASRLSDAVDLVQRLVSAGDTVYLHCNAGRERSPTIAAGWLAWYGGKGVAEAIQAISELRPGARPYAAMLTRLSNNRRR